VANGEVEGLEGLEGMGKGKDWVGTQSFPFPIPSSKVDREKSGRWVSGIAGIGVLFFSRC